MKRLTDRQRQVLDYLCKYLDENGCQPSQKEIASALGWKSPSVVTCHLKGLEAKGYVLLTKKARGIRILNRCTTVSRETIV